METYLLIEQNGHGLFINTTKKRSNTFLFRNNRNLKEREKGEKGEKERDQNMKPFISKFNFDSKIQNIR
jgi:hypothetical protein